MRKSPFTLLSLAAGACMVLVSGVALGQTDDRPERRTDGPAARQNDPVEARDVDQNPPADRPIEARDGAIDVEDADRGEARDRRFEDRDFERGDVRVERRETRRVSPDEERLRTQEIAWLGVYLDPRYSNHAVVEAVHVDSPADKAGVQAGDWILSVNDTEINSPAHLSRLIRSMEPGEQIDLGVSQRVEQHSEVELASRPVVRDRFRFDSDRRETLRTTTERDQVNGRFDRDRDIDRTRIDSRRDRDRLEEGRFEEGPFEGERRESLRVDPGQEDAAPRTTPIPPALDDSSDGDGNDGDSGDGGDGNDGAGNDDGTVEHPSLDADDGDNNDGDGDDSDGSGNDSDDSNVEFTPSGERIER